MKNFKELDKRNYSEVEQDILDSWGGINEINRRQIFRHSRLNFSIPNSSISFLLEIPNFFST